MTDRKDQQGQEVHGPQTNIDGDAKGPVLSGQFNSDVVFNMFAEAPILSHNIRIREFKTLVLERTKNFVGREFIFRAIDNLIQGSKFPSGYIVIRGEPGIGKTSLIAQLVKQRGYVHHFNIATQNIRSARDFLGNLCAQLIVRYELDHAILPPEATKNSGFLLQLLEEASAKLKGMPLVMLLDALDEAEDLGLPPEANHLYLPLSLPSRVFFVVSTREQADYRLFVDHREDIYLRDDPANLEDVKQYIRDFVHEHRDQMLQRIQTWGVTEDEFTEVITEKSQGNFMYLVHVLRDIHDGKLSTANIDDIRKLPRGLRAYYQRHWRAMRDQDIERFEKYYEPIVCMLATVREPVTVGQVAKWTELNPMRVKEIIREWREFLNQVVSEEENTLYRVYHASFQDFLRDEVGLTNYDHIISQSALDKIRW